MGGLFADEAGRAGARSRCPASHSGAGGTPQGSKPKSSIPSWISTVISTVASNSASVTGAGVAAASSSSSYWSRLSSSRTASVQNSAGMSKKSTT